MIKRFRIFSKILGAALFFLFLFPTQNVAADKHPHLGVVELFTSQGCSSCPPADALLETYVKHPKVIALSYGVDYWDYLGWKDKFGSPANSQRQRDYARTRGDGQVYTPQAIVNGVSHMNGAKGRVINRELKRTGQLLAKRQLSVSGRSTETKIILTFQSILHKESRRLTIWMLRVKDKGFVSINRGENKGREIVYHNVVLQSSHAGKIKSLKQPFIINKPKRSLQSDEQWVFLVQEGATGPIVGAMALR